MNLVDKLLITFFLLIVLGLGMRLIGVRIRQGKFLAALAGQVLVLLLFFSLQWNTDALQFGWIWLGTDPMGKIDFGLTADPLAMTQAFLLWTLSFLFLLLSQAYLAKDRETSLLESVPMILLGILCISLSQFALALFMGLGFLFFALSKTVREESVIRDRPFYAQAVQGRFLVGMAFSVLAWAFIQSRGVILGSTQSWSPQGPELGVMTLGASLLAFGLLILSGLFSFVSERDFDSTGSARLRWLVTEVLPSAVVGFVFFKWDSFFNGLGIFPVLGFLLLARSLFAWLMVIWTSGSIRELNFLRGTFAMGLGSGMLAGADGVWVGVLASTLSNVLFVISISSLMGSKTVRSHAQSSSLLCLPLIGLVGFMPFYAWLRVLTSTELLVTHVSLCLLVFLSAFSSWRLFSECGSLYSFKDRKLAWICWGLILIVSTTLFWTGGPLTGLLEQQAGLWFFNIEKFVTRYHEPPNPMAWTWFGYLQGSMVLGLGLSVWIAKYWQRWESARKRMSDRLENLFGLVPFTKKSADAMSSIVIRFDHWQVERLFGEGLHQLRLLHRNGMAQIRYQTERVAEVCVLRMMNFFRHVSTNLVDGLQRRDDHWYLLLAFLGFSFLIFLLHWFGGSK